MMKKSLLSLIFSFVSMIALAQTEFKQDIGINMAGLLIKNQATVLPSLFYKYHLKDDYQLRFQVAIDGNLNTLKRNGGFSQGGPFGSFAQDSILNFDPGKNFRYGIMAGIQKNRSIEGTDFSYFYGLDIIFMMDDFKQSGRGVVLQGSGGFDTTKQRLNIKIDNSRKLNTFGIGLPMGICYTFGKRFYTALEAKFVIAYQDGRFKSKTETSQIQQFEEITIKTEANSDLQGFDIGIKPLTGLSVGMFF
jgi:hypothetical protein